ncbi:Craniofacial development protein 2 [Mytilus edulis]|uniref:Craniofacial development protein 2 n=1 Tax=Mytilus edulis TaxID=6550 RepID=A0A8S3SEX2_MYTED|nr:Craniofacial development protein 2 [Mytilus edulis]
MDPKKTIKIGAWNVRTMFQVSKTAQVIREMERYQLGILGISECRWTESGKIITQGHTIIYSGRNDNQHTEGVAIIMNKECTKSLIEWEPINERLIRARFSSSYAKTTIIQCYSTTNDTEEEINDAYYEALQAQISKTPLHDVLLIIGDQNAKVVKLNTKHERAMGKEGHGVMNENGERLASMCSTNELVIGGTLFKHKDIHKTMWNSPNNRDKNQIDHIIINGKWRRSLRDTEHLEEQISIEKKWENIKEVYHNTSEKIIGFRKSSSKQWLTSFTWKAIDERTKLKEKVLSTRSSRLKEQTQKEYAEKDKEVKKRARKDKKNHLEDRAEEAEKATARGDLSTVYKITKELCGQSKQPPPVKDKMEKSSQLKKGTITLNTNHYKETDWFKVQSGVRKDCIISPILFLVAIDWVMRKTTSDKKRGLTWSMFEDLDFADDIPLLSSKQDHMKKRHIGSAILQAKLDWN